MTPWPLRFGLLALAAASTDCNAEAARGATVPAAVTTGKETSAPQRETPVAAEPHPAPDGGSATNPSASANDHDEVVDLSETVVGLTRAQVRARRGPPTEIRGSDWIYIPPEQEGCRDVVISEVLTFKGGVVVKFRLQRRQTGKVCRRR